MQKTPNRTQTSHPKNSFLPSAVGPHRQWTPTHFILHLISHASTFSPNVSLRQCTYYLYCFKYNTFTLILMLMLSWLLVCTSKPFLYVKTVSWFSHLVCYWEGNSVLFFFKLKTWVTHWYPKHQCQERFYKMCNNYVTTSFYFSTCESCSS